MNNPDFRLYVSDIQNNKMYHQKEKLTHVDQYNEYIMTGLRTMWGISLSNLQEKFGTNQIELITNIAKSIPIDYELLVKEHYNMAQFAWRPISFYKKILELQNVKLVHYSIPPDQLLKDCSLVLTITGTTGLESALYKKPSIVFSDLSFSYLPYVKRIRSYEDLPDAIRELLNSNHDYNSFANYADLVKSNSFEFNITTFTRSLRKILFSSNYELREMKILPKDVESLFTTHHDEFEKLADEHIAKIKNFNRKNND